MGTGSGGLFACSSAMALYKGGEYVTVAHLDYIVSIAAHIPRREVRAGAHLMPQKMTGHQRHTLIFSAGCRRS